MKTKLAIVFAGLLGAGLAQAQSHSVANYSNPPNVQADSKAGTDATPGLSATSSHQDVHHTNKNKPNGKHKNIGKGVKSKNGADSATTNQPKPGAEATLQKDPSEAVDPAQQKAFNSTSSTSSSTSSDSKQ
jgi:hypothetical protein